MRIALDANILAYAEGVDGDARKQETLAALDVARASSRLVIPAQALGELFSVLTRKARRERTAVREAVLSWTRSCEVIATTPAVMLEALEIAARHQVPIWDAVMLAAAASVGCDLLLSEDFQHGFAWRGVTVRNPFAAPV